MKTLRALAAALALSAVIALSGCAAPVVPPTVYNASDLQNNIVTIPLDGMLVINTASLDVDSYTAEIADPEIAEFVQGKVDAGASSNPGFTPLKVGETKITLENKDGGIQQVVFTLKVTE